MCRCAVDLLKKRVVIYTKILPQRGKVSVSTRFRSVSLLSLTDVHCGTRRIATSLPPSNEEGSALRSCIQVGGKLGIIGRYRCRFQSIDGNQSCFAGVSMRKHFSLRWMTLKGPVYGRWRGRRCESVRRKTNWALRRASGT